MASAPFSWPGYAARFCPVCRRAVHTHRKPPNDERGEVVIYQKHRDKIGERCLMGGRAAAIGAVAFTGHGR